MPLIGEIHLTDYVTFAFIGGRLKKQELISQPDYCPKEVLKLVEELIKKTPNEKKIQTLTASLGIDYCDDSNHQIKTLLNALNTKFAGQRKL